MGRLHGAHRRLGKLVLSDDPVAADFVTTRFMGLTPGRVRHLNRASSFLGTLRWGRIDLLAERMTKTLRPCDILP